MKAKVVVMAVVMSAFAPHYDSKEKSRFSENEKVFLVSAGIMATGVVIGLNMMNYIEPSGNLLTNTLGNLTNASCELVKNTTSTAITGIMTSLGLLNMSNVTHAVNTSLKNLIGQEKKESTRFFNSLGAENWKNYTVCSADDACLIKDGVVAAKCYAENLETGKILKACVPVGAPCPGYCDNDGELQLCNETNVVLRPEACFRCESICACSEGAHCGCGVDEVAKPKCFCGTNISSVYNKTACTTRYEYAYTEEPRMDGPFMRCPDRSIVEDTCNYTYSSEQTATDKLTITPPKMRTPAAKDTGTDSWSLQNSWTTSGSASSQKLTVMNTDSDSWSRTKSNSGSISWENTTSRSLSLDSGSISLEYSASWSKSSNYSLSLDSDSISFENTDSMSLSGSNSGSISWENTGSMSLSGSNSGSISWENTGSKSASSITPFHTISPAKMAPFNGTFLGTTCPDYGTVGSYNGTSVYGIISGVTRSFSIPAPYTVCVINQTTGWQACKYSVNGQNVTMCPDNNYGLCSNSSIIVERSCYHCVLIRLNGCGDLSVLCAIGAFNESVTSPSGLTQVTISQANIQSSLNSNFNISLYSPDWTYTSNVCKSYTGQNCSWADASNCCLPHIWRQGFTCPDNTTRGMIDNSCVVMNTPGYKACLYSHLIYTGFSGCGNPGVLSSNISFTACPNRWTGECPYQDQRQSIASSFIGCKI